MKLVILALSLGFVATTHADIGNGKILSCGNRSEKFTIYRTTKKRTGSLKQVMSCLENRMGDGTIKVVLESGGAIGIKSVQVYQAQEYPLEPVQIASLPCVK